MKNLMKSLMLVAVAAMGFTACSKESFADVTPELEPMVKMTITAEDASRTYLDEANDKAQWSESGEYIAVYQLAGEAVSSVQSEEGVVTDGKANFGVTFPTADGASFTYSAIYPFSANVADNNVNLEKIKLITPDTQKPTATSFDAAADLMIAKAVVAEAQPTNLSMQFKRVVAVAKMSLTNLPTTDKLVNVTFEATGKVLAGRSYFNILDGSVAEYGYNSPASMITLDYAEAPINNTNPIYFTCLPVELAAGDSFTVTATTENKVKYTRTVTLADAQILNFNEGKMSTFSVNMADAESESIASLEGEYAVMALAEDGSLHLMGNPSTTSTVYLTQTETDGTAIPEEYAYTDEQFVWVVEELENGRYSLQQKSSGKYVSWSSGNSANLQTTAYELTIVKNENGSFNVASASDATRKLQYNENNPRFAFYTSEQVAIYLVPARLDTEPSITAANIEGIAANGIENATCEVVLKNITETVAVTCDDTVVTDASLAGSTLTYTVAANTGEAREGWIKLAANGVECTITVSQIAPSADGTKYYVKVASSSSDWSGKYLIVWGTNAHATVDYKDLKATVSGLTIEDNKIEATASVDKAAVTIAKNGSNYSIYLDQAGTYLSNSKNSSGTSSTPFDWTLEYTTDGVKMYNSTGTTYILYNNGNQYFRCYTDKSGMSGYTLPTLYKLED